MGKFKVIVSDKAKKDFLTIQISGDKASIKLYVLPANV